MICSSGVHVFLTNRSKKVLLAGLGFLILAACTIAGRAEAADTSAGVIRSAAEIDYPPFSMADEQGRADGFAVDLMRAALAAMGHAATFRTGPWAEVRGWLERGEIQALPLVGRTPERESLFDFTFPYMTLHGAIVVRKGTTGIRTLADLKGRQVAVMRGDNAEEFLRREDRGIAIRTTLTFGEALRELSQGRHDAVFMLRLVALRLLRLNGLTNLAVVDTPVSDFNQEFCFAVREGDRDTLALLNEGLALVVADGTHRRLHAKWFAQLELPTQRRIVIGGDHNFPPYEYLDADGRPAGYNVDLTRAIAQEVGLDIAIRLGPWAEVRQALARGEIDVIQGMFYSPERERTFDFTPSHAVNHCVAVVRRGSGPAPGTLAELSAKRIVVQRGDIMHDFALEHGLAHVTAVDAQQTALRELAAGRHDCALVSRLTALYWIERHGWQDLVVGKRPLLSPEYCYAVTNEQKALLAQFAEGLRILEETGEYRRIQEKWFGVYADVRPSFSDIVRYAGLVVGPLVVLVLVFFVWSWSLRRQVAQQTRKLAESARRYRLLADNSEDVIFTLDTDLRYTYVSPSVKTLRGVDPSEVIGRSIARTLPPDSLARATTLFDEELAAARRNGPARRPARTIELQMYDRNGATVWTEVKASFLWDEHGRPAGLLGVTRDISIRKKAQQALQESEQRLQAILESNPNPIVVYDSRGWPQYLNPAFTTVFGWTLDELQGRRIPFVPDDQKETTAARIEAIYATGQAVRFASTRLTREGRMLDVIVSAAVVKGTAGRGIGMVVNLIDISEQRTLERQLRQSQKMESVGRLAGGVAHDYNNMLSLIIGYTELAMEKVDPQDALHGDLQEIYTAAQRSAAITRQLLAFARKQTIAPRVLDLNETVEGMLKMLRRLIGENIELVWLPGRELWRVNADPSQIDQILANVCVNARDAIGDVGHVTIETRNRRFDPGYCADHAGYRPGDFVMLAVSDDGSGMDRETLDNAFEPFFTTKGVGRGTGLGLATVYGIVQQNNGFVNIYSEPGEGTTIRIYLPRDSGAMVDIRPSEPEPMPPGRGEVVLLVEDDASILELGRKMLAELGYRVLAARTPGEALERSGRDGCSLELLVTDVIMPEMNGRELADRIRSHHPGLRVLFMSGYSENVIAHHGVLDAGVHFMQKPFSKKEMAFKAREALDEERATGSTGPGA